jgi:hypothetical protein
MLAYPLRGNYPSFIFDQHNPKVLAPYGSSGRQCDPCLANPYHTPLDDGTNESEVGILLKFAKFELGLRIKQKFLEKRPSLTHCVGKAYVIAKLMQSEIEVLHGETKAVLW